MFVSCYTGQANEERAKQFIEEACSAATRRVDKGGSGSGDKKQQKKKSRGGLLRGSSGGGKQSAHENSASSDAAAQAALAAATAGFTPAEDRLLLSAMRLLLDAAEHFQKARLPGSAVRCSALAALVAYV
jgi:hypothetical protein